MTPHYGHLQNIVPNAVAHKLETPDCILMKFSVDGRYLLAMRCENVDPLFLSYVLWLGSYRIICETLRRVTLICAAAGRESGPPIQIAIAARMPQGRSFCLDPSVSNLALPSQQAVVIIL